MGIIEEIKGRIERLSEVEYAELRAGFVERDQKLWDEQIASDQATGKLDDLIAEAKAARSVGKARAL